MLHVSTFQMTYEDLKSNYEKEKEKLKEMTPKPPEPEPEPPSKESSENGDSDAEKGDLLLIVILREFRIVDYLFYLIVQIIQQESENSICIPFNDNMA